MKLAMRLLINVLGQMSKKVQLVSRLRILSPVFSGISGGSAGTGRQAGLRIQWSNPWGFKSPLPHHHLTSHSSKIGIIPKNQSDHDGTAGFLFALSPRLIDYKITCANGPDLICLLTRPEYVEVMP